MVAGMRKLVVAKGKKVLQFDLGKEPLAGEELSKALLGPSGNLRAPTLKAGKTMLVGINEEAYDLFFG